MIFIYSHVALILAASLGAFVFGNVDLAVAYFSGALIATLNFLALSFLWKQIFEKKHVALAAFSIVIKYAILGLIIYVFVTNQGLKTRLAETGNIFAFSLGIATILVTIVILGKKSLKHLGKLFPVGSNEDISGTF
jgi:hypothetical protein